MTEPTVPEFPTHVLPDWLRAEVEAVAAAHQVPADLPGLLSLSLVALGAARRVRVRPNPNGDWREPCNIYTATALPPGTGKSPVFERLMRPARVVEAELAQASAAEVTRTRVAREVAEKRAAKVAEAAIKATTDQERDRLVKEAGDLEVEAQLLEVRAPARLLADDVTPEQLATLLHEQSGRLGIFSDEGGVFQQMLGRYSNGVANLDVYLKGHSAGTIQVDRRGRRERVEGAHLTLGLAVQPKVLQDLGQHQSLKGLGLTARFLFALPADMVGSRDLVNAPAVPAAVEAAYEVRMEGLLRSLCAAEPVVVDLDDAARAVFEEFQARNEGRLAFGGDLFPVREWGAKLPGAVLRIAGLLHVAGRFESGFACPVDAATVRAAVELAEYLVPHYLAVASLMVETAADQVAKKVLEWVKAKRPAEFSQRDLFRSLRSQGIRQSADLVEPLQLLVERGWLARVEQSEEERSKGGRPSARFVPHPKLLELPESKLEAADAEVGS